jgi:hypothetical protein
MKLTGILCTSSTVFIMACASAPPASVPAPVSQPSAHPAQPAPPTVSAAPRPTAVHGGPWTFSYAPGTYTYAITTAATIAPLSDTTQKRPLPDLTQKATVAISAVGDVQVIDPVIPTPVSCDSVAAALAMRAQQIIPRLPSHLNAGDHWRDSTTTSGCRGAIAAESQIISNYVVVGDSTFDHIRAVQVHRTDSLSASGEGTDGQHRIMVSATGTGSADLFLDTSAGRFVGSQGQQTSLLRVTTSGRVVQFAQHVSESVAITALP